MTNLPQVKLKVNMQEEILPIGFNFITPQSDWRTVVSPSITKSESVTTDEGSR